MPVASISKGLEIQINLPPLHSGQIAIAQSNARFKVVMCGRRFGKTFYGARECFAMGATGKRAWWVAPNYKIANEGWDTLKSLARQVNDALNSTPYKIEIREADRQLVFNWFKGQEPGKVEVRSSDVEGSLRGAGLDLVVIDEAASHRPTVWTEELRPALIDKRGACVFIGTPKGNNWFSQLYERASKGFSPNWAAWKRTTWDNPLISTEERAEIEAEYIGRPDKYSQEIMADIGASQYLVYPQFNRDVHTWKKPIPKFVAYYGGLDFGGDQIGSHKSAGIMFGVTERDEMVAVREFEESGPNITERQMNWMAETENRLKMLHMKNKWPTAPIFWTADKSQMKFVDILKSYGFRIRKSKGGKVRAGVDLVSSRLTIRSTGKPMMFYLPHLVKFPEHLESYHNYEPNDEFDAIQKENPVKVNDDLDDAIRYAIESKDGRTMGNPQDIFKKGLLRLAPSRV